MGEVQASTQGHTALCVFLLPLQTPAPPAGLAGARAAGSHLQGSFAVSSHLHVNLVAQGKLSGTEEGK